ncbi:MAG: tetratricopeptide repeat protein [Planctomycetales bacterium]
MPLNTPAVRRILGWLAILGVVGLAAFAAHWQRARREASPPVPDTAAPVEPLVKPSPVPTGYVGSDQCRECHRDLWGRYQTHPMAHSAFPVLETDPREEFEKETSFARGNREYRVERTDAGVWHHELAHDAAGELIYDQKVQVHYAIGSGRRGRSYVIDRGGLLFLSSISWYAQSARWDLAPRYIPRAHQRFERRAVERCLYCHVGQAAPQTGQNDRFDDPPFREMSIGCERCHGPGAEHIAWRRSPADPRGEDPIVNPARLDSRRQESICNQCHLQGSAEVLRYGRSHFDFRPGMHLGEVWSIFVQGNRMGPDGSTEAISQVQQMHSSFCFERSRGKLVCTSCHDPHYSPPPGGTAAFYRTRCLTCHAEDACELPESVRREPPADNSCIHCHMPRLSASDVPHTTQTDHRVMRLPSSVTAPPMAMGMGMPAFEIFDAVESPLPEADMQRAQGLLLANAAEQQRSHVLSAEAERMLRPLVEQTRDDRAAVDALAVACALRRDTDSAIALWTEILRESPDHESTLLSLVTIHRRRKEPQQALDYLVRLLEVNPWTAQFHVLRGTLLGELGRLAEGIEALEQARSLNPSDPQICDSLAALYQQAHDPRQSAAMQTLARRLRRESP